MLTQARRGQVAGGKSRQAPINGREPKPPGSMPDCPDYLAPEAKAERARIASILNQIGLLTQVDRPLMACYCQTYARRAEAERKLAETPLILRTPAGYIQQSPWLSIANKQLELLAKYLTELGLTPASRSRLAIQMHTGSKPWEPITQITRIILEPAAFKGDKRAPTSVRPGVLMLSADSEDLQDHHIDYTSRHLAYTIVQRMSGRCELGDGAAVYCIRAGLDCAAAGSGWKRSAMRSTPLPSRAGLKYWPGSPRLKSARAQTAPN